MGDAQPISERVNRWQGLFESLPFLSDNMAAKVCGCLYTKEFYERQFKNIWSEGFLHKIFEPISGAFVPA